MNIFFFKEKDR